MTGKSLGTTYGAITFVLVAAIFMSGWCWGSQSGPGSSMRLHDVCLTVWAVSGVLLALSQIVFIVLALRMNTNVATTMGLAAGSSEPDAAASVSKILILVFGAVILMGIGLFVLILASMPS